MFTRYPWDPNRPRLAILCHLCHELTSKGAEGGLIEAGLKCIETGQNVVDFFLVSPFSHVFSFPGVFWPSFWPSTWWDGQVNRLQRVIAQQKAKYVELQDSQRARREVPWQNIVGSCWIPTATAEKLWVRWIWWMTFYEYLWISQVGSDNHLPMSRCWWMDIFWQVDECCRPSGSRPSLGKDSWRISWRLDKLAAWDGLHYIIWLYTYTWTWTTLCNIK